MYSAVTLEALARPTWHSLRPTWHSIDSLSSRTWSGVTDFVGQTPDFLDVFLRLLGIG